MKLTALFLNILITWTSTNSVTIVNKAIEVQKKYNVPNKKYVVMIDYSESINSERMYLVNTQKKQIELTSVVSHARNSGIEFLTEFSNQKGTLMSSLGA
jgi:hypothetical protein